MRKIWERKISVAKALGRDWDIQFWQAQGASVRFKAAWQMLQDFYRMRGEKLNAGKLRLQRAVENLK